MKEINSLLINTQTMDRNSKEEFIKFLMESLGQISIPSCEVHLNKQEKILREDLLWAFAFMEQNSMDEFYPLDKDENHKIGFLPITEEFFKFIIMLPQNEHPSKKNQWPQSTEKPKGDLSWFEANGFALYFSWKTRNEDSGKKSNERVKYVFRLPSVKLWQLALNEKYTFELNGHGLLEFPLKDDNEYIKNKIKNAISESNDYGYGVIGTIENMEQDVNKRISNGFSYGRAITLRAWKSSLQLRKCTSQAQRITRHPRTCIPNARRFSRQPRKCIPHARRFTLQPRRYYYVASDLRVKTLESKFKGLLSGVWEWASDWDVSPVKDSKNDSNDGPKNGSYNFSNCGEKRGNCGGCYQNSLREIVEGAIFPDFDDPAFHHPKTGMRLAMEKLTGMSKPSENWRVKLKKEETVARSVVGGIFTVSVLYTASFWERVFTFSNCIDSVPALVVGMVTLYAVIIWSD